MTKKILKILLALIVIIQFFRPERNNSNELTYDVTKKYKVPDEVAMILKNACNDCHSNNTEYPWYSKVQPVAWWMDEHIKDGKRNLNFSELLRLPIAVQNHKFDEVIEILDKNEMPLESYTYFGLHQEANLSEDEKTVLKNWARKQMDYLKSTYPADSLVLKRRKKPE